VTPKRNNLIGREAITTLKPTFPALMTACGKHCHSTGIIVFGIALLFCCVQEISVHGWMLKHWDMLLISGLVTFLAGVWVAQRIPIRLEQALARLANRGALEGSQEQIDEFVQFLSDRATKWSSFFSLLCASAILIAFIVAFWGRFTPDNIVLTALEVFGGYLAGFHLGRMAFYGQLGALLKLKDVRLKASPGHMDGAGGLKPVGDFYFFQAMVVGIPAMFLAVWLLLLPLWPRYARWEEPYLGLLLFSITIEVLAFILPLISFHRVMKEQKEGLLRTADELSAKINDLRSRLVIDPGCADRQQMTASLAEMTDYYWAIENMPTWPVDARARRRFGIDNLLLLTPFASKWFGLPIIVQQLLDAVTKLRT